MGPIESRGRIRNYRRKLPAGPSLRFPNGGKGITMRREGWLQQRADCLAPSNPVIKAAMEGTSDIPILATAPDLLASGAVTSLSRPTGNVTGISLTAGSAFAEKWVELAKETIPDLTKIGIVWNAESAASIAYMHRIRTAAFSLGIKTEGAGVQLRRTR